jgi:hypothetical protein
MSVPSIPYSSTRRKRLHCARRIFLNPRTGPGTRCDFGQNGQTNRVPCAFGMRSTITPQPGLHSLYSTGSGGATTGLAARTGLAAIFVASTFAACFFTTRFGFTRLAAARARARRAAAARPFVLLVLAARAVLVARMTSALARPPCFCRPDSPSETAAARCRKNFFAYFRRSTMLRSVRLLLRVFLPSVGKAHGVCG